MADGNITVEVSTHAAQAELERLRTENAALKAQLVPLLLLAQEVQLIGAHGATPDGDGVNGPTALWAEDWTRRLGAAPGPNAEFSGGPATADSHTTGRP